MFLPHKERRTKRNCTLPYTNEQPSNTRYAHNTFPLYKMGILAFTEDCLDTSESLLYFTSN